MKIETKRKLKVARAVFALLVFLAAAAFVVEAWFHVRDGGKHDWNTTRLAERGTFGDSFGMLSALFAGFALLGAAIAAYFQWVAMREAEEAAAANAVESRFFQLLNTLLNIINSTRVGTYDGRQALRKANEKLTRGLIGRRKHLGAGDDISMDIKRKDIDDWYTSFYEGLFINGEEKDYRAGDLLGHLFRLTYHIVKFVDESNAVDAEQKKFYIRLLRAHLANPELVMLLYNGLSWRGYPEMFKLIEDHDLLQSVQIESLPDWNDALHYPRLVPLVAKAKERRDAGGWVAEQNAPAVAPAVPLPA